MTIESARRIAWNWICQDGDDDCILQKIAEYLRERIGSDKVKYAGGKLFIGGEEIREVITTIGARS